MSIAAILKIISVYLFIGFIALCVWMKWFLVIWILFWITAIYTFICMNIAFYLLLTD